MTKANILECLNEIGHRFVRTGCEDDVQHYKELGLAFSVAYSYICSLPADQVERRAQVIEDLGLGQGSVQ
jgi:hypothetical protein